jgi:hypothetical protein
LSRNIRSGIEILTQVVNLQPGSKIVKKPSKAQAKVKKVMGEYKAGELHSGSKTGPKVTSQKQAVAIAMSEAKKAKKKKK